MEKGKIHRLIKQVFFYQWVACGALCIKRKSAQPSYTTSQSQGTSGMANNLPTYTEQNRLHCTVPYLISLGQYTRCKHLPLSNHRREKSVTCNQSNHKKWILISYWEFNRLDTFSREYAGERVFSIKEGNKCPGLTTTRTLYRTSLERTGSESNY